MFTTLLNIHKDNRVRNWLKFTFNLWKRLIVSASYKVLLWRFPVATYVKTLFIITNQGKNSRPTFSCAEHLMHLLNLLWERGTGHIPVGHQQAENEMSLRMYFLEQNHHVAIRYLADAELINTGAVTIHSGWGFALDLSARGIWYLHHDTAPTHYLHLLQIVLSLSMFFLFPKPKEIWFESQEGMMRYVTAQLYIPKGAFLKCLL